MTIGERIKLVRESRGMSQEALGSFCGSGKQTIYKYENNIVSNIPLDKIEKIAAALMVSPSYLMGWTDSSSPEKNKSAIMSDDELSKSIYELLGQLTQSDLEKVAAFLQGLLASR